MKKVLVLCQRKSGWLYAGKIEGEDVYKKVENTVVPKINELVSSLIGDAYAIEYLSSFTDDHSTGKLDIEGILKNDEYLTLKGNKKIAVSDFIEENKETYDIILLNTCPFQSMDFNLISQLLSPDGRIVLVAFTGSGRNINIKRTIDLPNEFFTLDKTEGDEVLIYKKKKSPMKKTTSSHFTKTKNGGRRKTKRKTKKRRTFTPSHI